jgi:hypothetical protein
MSRCEIHGRDNDCDVITLPTHVVLTLLACPASERRVELPICVYYMGVLEE